MGPNHSIMTFDTPYEEFVELCFLTPLWWTLMMETELVSETLVFNSKLTRLMAREDFITFMRRESFKSYITLGLFLRTGFRIRWLYCVTVETFLMHWWTHMMCTRMSLFDSTAWTWGTEHGKPLSWPLIIQQPQGVGGRGGGATENKHTALLNLNTTLFVLCGHHIVLTVPNVQQWLMLSFFLVLCGHYVMLTLVSGKNGVWFFRVDQLL
jgi:hypothetical protein